MHAFQLLNERTPGIFSPQLGLKSPAVTKIRPKEKIEVKRIFGPICRTRNRQTFDLVSVNGTSKSLKLPYLKN